MTSKTSADELRNPIITVCGHVDHGKTSLLDRFRGSSVQQGEAGGITQKISFTRYTYERMKEACPLIEKNKIALDFNGFLFIDTPGHAAFTNLRKRGGSLADIALLVIDINEGIKPQTAEVIQILKHNKTPFIIALNKIDNISGWPLMKGKPELIKDKIETLPSLIRQRFDEKLFTFEGALHSHGFESDLFYNVSDFTKKVALVPCSAKTGEGIQELILVLCGMSQKYLHDKLKLGVEAKGVILEVKKEKSNFYAESILYDGTLREDDEIAIASLEGKPIMTKIKVLEEIEPLSIKFKKTKEATASTGLRLQLKVSEAIQSGMPFLAINEKGSNIKEIEEQFKKVVSENVTSMISKQGIIAKADSLGSLEALLVLLKQNNIEVVKAGIGQVNKTDVISAKANLELNELDAIIVAFNVTLDEEAIEFSKNSKIKIIENAVVYKIIEGLLEFREKKKSEIEKSRLMELATVCKLTVLHKYIFRNSNPAVFGVKVEGGKLTKNLQLIDSNDKAVARVKEIQLDKKSVSEAHEGQELAISLPGINFERQLKETTSLYSDLGERQFKKFKENRDLLSEKEKKILVEIADIKRKKKSDWGV